MIGTTEHCDSQSSAPPSNNGAGIQWGLLRPAPDIAGSYSNGYALGAALAAQREANRQAALLREEREANIQAQKMRDAEADRTSAAELAEAKSEIHLLQLQRRLDRAQRIGLLANQHQCSAVWAAANEDTSDVAANALAAEFCPTPGAGVH